jgi:hypothetical protein
MSTNLPDFQEKCIDFEGLGRRFTLGNTAMYEAARAH